MGPEIKELPQGWTYDEEPESDLPTGWKYEDETSPTAPSLDPISDELREMGYEPDSQEAFERELEHGYSQSFAGRLSKGFAAGTSFGATSNIPGFESEGTVPEAIGYVAGSLIPLSALTDFFVGNLVNFASKSPILQSQASALARLTGIGLTGATNEALESIAQGEIPDAEDVLEHGLQWVALDVALNALGVVGRFTKNLFTKAQDTGKNSAQLVNEVIDGLQEAQVDLSIPEQVGEAAMEVLQNIPENKAGAFKASQRKKLTEEVLTPEIIEITPKDLKSKKIKVEEIIPETEKQVILSEPYLPKEMNFIKEADALENTAVESMIESIGPSSGSQEELGLAVKENVEKNLIDARAAYAPLYDIAEEASEVIIHNPYNAVRESGERLRRLERLTTRPPNYASTINQLESVIKDTGYKIQRDEFGDIELIVLEKHIPVSHSIELGRRINNLINYESIDPEIKDILRPIARAIKQDIRAGLASNPDALAAYELAEAEHGRVATIFNRDSIRRIRQTEAGERIANMIESPTSISDLRQVASPAQMQQVERNIVEKINSYPYEKAKKTLREVQRHLSPEARSVAKEVIEAKNPHNPQARKKITQDAILNEMSTALTNGTRPEKTLNLWKTKKGQNLIESTFKDSPNWQPIKQYLEHQSFNDMVSSILKDGKIDLKKLNEFLQNPNALENIEMIGGKQAVDFFKNFNDLLKNLKSNLNLLEETAQKNLGKLKEGTKTTGEKGRGILKRMGEKQFPNQAKIKKWKDLFKETMGISAQGFVSVFGLMKLGLPNAVAMAIGFKIMTKLVTNPRLRKAFSQAAKKHIDPLKFILAIENFADVLDEEESEVVNPQNKNPKNSSFPIRHI